MKIQPMLVEGTALATFRQRLLDWFATAARDLPWRRTRDPYHILVSEVMLQQTQVDRVLPKYAAFLEAFPTLDALANASTAEVIKCWAGLGYNRRAVNLQRTARAVLQEHSGRFPCDVAVLRRLPGIGPYTAGAVACFAFGQDVAFMDTNIRRVLRRCLVGPEESGSAVHDRELLDLAQSLVPPGQGWRWNQAIMELGALICTATSPACWRCPVREHCRAFAAWRSADEQVFTTDVTGSFAYPLNLGVRPTRRVAEKREETYIGSRRYYRGRIVDVLRALHPGAALSLQQLGSQVRDDYAADHLPWLRDLVAGLARDGLIEVDDDMIRLPQT
ncbi:MAG: A/G-specific adenine glycosylase [Chloroflexales bacterium]|nr:A/G-specific adenine glycosylase [Chloroflexales bacterium]